MNLNTKQDMETGILIALALLLWAWLRYDWSYILIAGAVLGGSLILPIVFHPIA